MRAVIITTSENKKKILVGSILLNYEKELLEWLLQFFIHRFYQFHSTPQPHLKKKEYNSLSVR